MTGVGRSLQASRMFLVVVPLVLAVAFLSSHTAHAQAAPIDEAGQARDQEARRLFEAGRAAYVEEKYQDALNYFQEAHELSGRPQLLFNVGQAADRLGQREHAARAFRDYLAAVPDADNRAEVEARIAQLEAPESDATESEAVLIGEQEAERRSRDGFYLRGGIGLGGLSDEFSFNLGTLKGKASGPTGALELAIGMAVRPGLALAGVIGIEWATVNEISIEGSTVKDGQVGVLGMFGGMVDWYLKPNEGWHVQGGIVLTRLTVKGDENAALADHSPVGGGMFLGGGHEWPVRKNLSMGVLGRLTGTQLKGDDFTHNVFALSVMFSATMF